METKVFEFRTFKGVEREKFDHKCRLCLSTETLEKVIKGGELAKCISDLLAIQVTGTDGFSQLICATCRNRVNEFQKFKERCQEVQGRLIFAKKDVIWPCYKCPKVFKGKRQLKDHLRYHGPKCFTCTVCGKGFARKSLLVTHSRIHAEGYPSRRLKSKLNVQQNVDAQPEVKIEPKEENDFSSESEQETGQHDVENEEELSLDNSSDLQLQNIPIKQETAEHASMIDDVGAESDSFVVEDMVEIQQVKLEVCSDDEEERPTTQTSAELSETSPASRSKRKKPIGVGPLTCDLCQKDFWLQIRLDQHMKRKHDTKKLCTAGNEKF
ncbi:zinc finger protein 189-like isoform X2 [Aedes aegypti]|uniref:Uncharacterized protein n=1 Tax=Aedes aegypti TaxID=7159 RepID=A0A6I8U4G7_AEDAE|nr:zinc finger protein 189-like isoform X2 [Aedes aegypti]